MCHLTAVVLSLAVTDSLSKGVPSAAALNPVMVVAWTDLAKMFPTFGGSTAICARGCLDAGVGCVSAVRLLSLRSICMFDLGSGKAALKRDLCQLG